MFAEHEPRIKGCVAYAAPIDLQAKFGTAPRSSALALFLPGVGDFARDYSPRNHEHHLACPILLFHAQDDDNVKVPPSHSRDCAARLKAMGKDATLDDRPRRRPLRPDGPDPGIDRGIAWMNGATRQAKGLPAAKAPSAGPGLAPVILAPPATPPLASIRPDRPNAEPAEEGPQFPTQKPAGTP